MAVDSKKSCEEIIAKNCYINNVGNVTILIENAIYTLYKHGSVFDLIEIDPFGSPIEMLDAVVTAASEGALLAINFTDMQVLCGYNREVTFYRYDVISAKTSDNKENAVRTAIYSIFKAAGKHKKAVKVVFSYIGGFFVRVFVRLYSSAEKCKESAEYIGRVHG